MTAALRGRRNLDKRRARHELLIAYQTGAFAGLAFNGELKEFAHYASQASDDRKPQHIQAVAFFHGLKAKGLPVSIERVTRH